MRRAGVNWLSAGICRGEGEREGDDMRSDQISPPPHSSAIMTSGSSSSSSTSLPPPALPTTDQGRRICQVIKVRPDRLAEYKEVSRPRFRTRDIRRCSIERTPDTLPDIRNTVARFPMRCDHSTSDLGPGVESRGRACRYGVHHIGRCRAARTHDGARPGVSSDAGGKGNEGPRGTRGTTRDDEG